MSVDTKICRDCPNTVSVRFSELCNSCLTFQNALSSPWREENHEPYTGTINEENIEISSACTTTDCKNNRAHESTKFCFDCISKFIKEESQIDISNDGEYKCRFCRNYSANYSRALCDTCSSVCHRCGTAKTPDSTDLCDICSAHCPKCNSFSKGVEYCKWGEYGPDRCSICDSICPNCNEYIEDEKFYKHEYGLSSSVDICKKCKNESKGNLICSNCGSSTRNVGINGRLLHHSVDFNHRGKILCNACTPHTVRCGVCNDSVEIKLDNSGGYTNLNISLYLFASDVNWYRCTKKSCRDTDLCCSECYQKIEKGHLINLDKLLIKELHCTDLCKKARDLSDVKSLFSKHYSSLKEGWAKKSFARRIAEGIIRNPEVRNTSPIYSVTVVINRADFDNYHDENDYYSYRRSYSKIWERELLEFEELLFSKFSEVTVEIGSWKVQRLPEDPPSFDYPLSLSYSCYE